MTSEADWKVRDARLQADIERILEAFQTGQSNDRRAEQLYAEGNYAAAEPLCHETLAMTRKSMGDEHPRVASSLNNLAGVLSAQGKLSEAEGLHREALAIRRKQLGDEHPDVPGSLNNLAALLHDRGKLSEAEPMHREALATLRRVLGSEHPDVASVLNNLAGALNAQGKLSEAEGLHREALAMRRRLLGDEHPGVAISLSNLAVLLYAQGELSEAEPLLNMALEISESARSRVGGDERDRAMMAGSLLLAELGAHLGIVLVRSQRPAEGLDVLERTRGRALLDLLSRSDRDLHDELRRRGDANLTQKLEQALTEGHAAQVQVRTAEVLLATTRQRTDLDEAEKAGLLEEQLKAVKKSRRAQAGFMRPVLAVLREVWPEVRALSGSQIGKQLQTGELMLCYGWVWNSVTLFVVQPENEGGIEGFVLAEGREHVAEEVDFVIRLRKNLANPSRALASATREHLEILFERLVPNQLRERVRSAERLIVLPDGPLNELPFDLLVSGKAGFLMNDKPEVVYAESGTLYVNRRREHEARSVSKNGKERTALVLGDCIFDRRPAAAELAGSGCSADIRTERGLQEAAARISATDHVRLFGKKLKPLPGTAREAQAVAELVRGGQEDGAVALLHREDATLAKLEAAVKGKRFVHLATHGLTGSRERPYDASLALTQPETPTVEDIGFLTLDHLIGRWRGKLDDCELVVASACDTQRGIKAGASVMALPWGFFFAGALSVVASLWKVSDAATALLMKRFYENLLGEFDEPRDGCELGEGLPKAVALCEAKQWLRSRTAHQVRKLLQKSNESDWVEWLRKTLFNDQELVVAVMGEGVISFRKPEAPEDRAVEITPDTFIFQHPFFWGAFILVGNADAIRRRTVIEREFETQ